MTLRLRSWARDTSGLAAIEFAFIAPIMILIYFSMAELCQGYMALKRTGHIAAMVADIVSRSDIITKQEAEDVLDIGVLIMKPFPTAALKQRVSSVTRDDETNYNVDWSVGVGKGMDEKLIATKDNIPSDLLVIGETAIVAEAEYNYQSPFGELTAAAPDFKRMAYLRPRSVDFIPCTGC